VSFAASATAELGERRYLVATLLIDAWLPRAMERDLAAAERKAMYWSSIYGPRRTRISEVFVPGAGPSPRAAAPPPQPQARPQPIPRAAPAAETPPQRERPRGGLLALLDRPVDPAYAKAMCDLFLLYIAGKLIERMFAGLHLTLPI
jgi:hypothetical protein